MQTDGQTNESHTPGGNVAAIRAKVFDDLATIPDYAVAVGKCERSIWTYVSQGLPVTYIGRTPHVVLSLASKYWTDRARKHNAPKRGRPPTKRAA